eukprot:CAMPEP_0181439538 /NCGR_PEP_ID=MMETSP1110-20121109/22482_1 /TAXON_ID=174948 /ORGANISM="Symbiodinium sp., Strain CCMP421" /LENGTH=135 /DNA_ID=CAMNT_0023563271 /DNA_START=56 /DNA_END=460 /DNA_ORIENTATION=-
MTDRFLSKGSQLGAQSVARNPFVDWNPSREQPHVLQEEPLHRRMARNPYTGFIQHSVCPSTSDIRRGKPIVIQPTRLSVGFAGTAPLLRRSSVRAATSLAPDLPAAEAAPAPCFAPLHLTWSEMREQTDFSEEMW